jgi:hypothetical protein
MDSVFPPLTERQERALKRMELLRELRKPSAWYWIKLLFARGLPRGRWLWARMAIAWAAYFFYLWKFKPPHSEFLWFAMILSTVWFAFALFDRHVMTPMQAKIEAARELLEQEQEKAL